MNTINVALHIHFSINESAAEETAVLQDKFEKGIFHEASQFGLHPQHGTGSATDGIYMLPVRIQAADQHEAFQKAKDWATEIAERESPVGLSVKKIETGVVTNDW